MNFLVSSRDEMVANFRGPLSERGETLWLVTFGELVARAPAAGSGLVVIDVLTDGFQCEALLKQLRKINPSLKILLAGANLPPMKELAALAAGALGCCGKEVDVEQIRKILNVVEEGGVWISNAALPHLLQRLRSKTGTSSTEPQESASDSGHLDDLTQREREIAQMVASGDSNKIIARKLNITDRTVKAHLTTVFNKLQVRDRLQLALYVNKGQRQA
jgi:DNA-binding NarL/FixJ family response regulator